MVRMHDCPDPVVWGRAPSPVRLDQSSAVAGGHGSALAVAAVTFSVVCLIFTAHAQSKTSPIAASVAKPATAYNTDAQLYRNSTFGFRYQIPYGWVDRTKEMQEGNEAGKSALLLAVFQRPPEATEDKINSAVVIASESTLSYPGIKKAEDYLGPLIEIATSQGFKLEGEPYALDVESRQLLRSDFAKTLKVKTTNDKLTMRQCTLVLLANGHIVSFTFIAGSEDELDDLMDGLHFGVAKSPTH